MEISGAQAKSETNVILVKGKGRMPRLFLCFKKLLDFHSCLIFYFYLSFVKKASLPYVSSKKSTNEPVAVNDQQDQPVQSKGSLITNTESSAENNQTTKSQALLTITPKGNSKVDLVKVKKENR